MGSEVALRLSQAIVEAVAEPETGRATIRPAEFQSSWNASDARTDEDLIGSIGKLSKEALGVLFHRHGRAVYNVAWRILRETSEAEDLRQEVFLYVFERAKLFDARKGTAASWIIQIAYHRAIDRRRYLGHRQHYNAPQFDEDHAEFRATPSITDAIDVTAILNRMKSELSVEQQQTLELHFFEGYSLREIAENSGQSVGNVRHHYYRALERLRSHLSAQKRP
jgi:RNA polymerase sigma-70 factor (ECF subfamily)